MTSVIGVVPDYVMEFIEGGRMFAPPVERDLVHEVHGSRSVVGGGDVGAECTQHEQGGRHRN
jgi:hypothetical protein